MTTKEFEQKIKRVLITEEEIQAKVREVGAQISREYEGKPLLLVSILVQDGLAGVGVEQVHRLGLAGGLDGHGIYRKARQCSSSGQCQREHQRRHAAEDGVFEHERAPLYLLADARQKFLF